MHHALQIQEILLNIFAHCDLPILQRCASELLALAGTCRTFKEPALDVLWEELCDSSPLARCLPEAACYLPLTDKYAFGRSLSQAEWDILRSYTRRIRTINLSHGLDWESVRTFLHPFTAEPLIPNLRYLNCHHATANILLLDLPLPSLISLDFALTFKENLRTFEDSLGSFHRLAPNIRRISIKVHQPDVAFNHFFSIYICRWRSLQYLLCPEISLEDVDTLVHLSYMPALVRLAFTLSAALAEQVALSDSSLVFASLHHLELHSYSLTSISNLLSRVRLPVLTDLSAFIESCPSKQKFISFFATLRTCGVGHTIQGLQLIQVHPSGSESDVHISGDIKFVLGFKDLRSCVSFRNLRRLDLDIGCDVVLTDNEVLTLTSVWPCFEHLVINHR